MRVERRAKFEGVRDWFLSDEIAFSSASMAFVNENNDGDAQSDDQPSMTPTVDEDSALVSLSHDPCATNGSLSVADDPSASTASPCSYRFRPIREQDRNAVQALHEEWFPVRYQDDFYDDLVRGGHPAERWALCDDDSDAADDDHTDERGPSDRTWSDPRNASHCQACSTTRPAAAAATALGRTLFTCVAVRGDDEEDPSRICACVVGCFLDAKSHLSPRLRNLLLPQTPTHTRAFYIMTLGVIPSCRKAGLGSRLVERCQRLVESDPSCGVLYLHVITFNTGAIRLYEKLGFYRVEEIENYYTIDGSHYNAFLFAKYFHGNRGHRDLFSLVRETASTLWKMVAASLPMVVLHYLPRRWSQPPRIRRD